jgi:hypothetical protein
MLNCIMEKTLKVLQHNKYYIKKKIVLYKNKTNLRNQQNIIKFEKRKS